MKKNQKKTRTNKSKQTKKKNQVGMIFNLMDIERNVNERAQKNRHERARNLITQTEHKEPPAHEH